MKLYFLCDLVVSGSIDLMICLNVCFFSISWKFSIFVLSRLFFFFNYVCWNWKMYIKIHKNMDWSARPSL